MSLFGSILTVGVGIIIGAIPIGLIIYGSHLAEANKKIAEIAKHKEEMEEIKEEITEKFNNEED